MMKIKYNSKTWQLAREFAKNIAYTGDLMDFEMSVSDYQFYTMQCKASSEEPLKGTPTKDGQKIYFIISYDMIEEED